MPEGRKLHEMVIVTRSGGHLTNVITISVSSCHSFCFRSSIVVVRTILQLPCNAFTQALLEVGLHTSTAHVFIVIYTCHLIFKAKISGVFVSITIASEFKLCPCCGNIIGSFSTTRPKETLHLVIVSPLVAYAPEIKVTSIGGHKNSQITITTNRGIATCIHHATLISIEKLAVLHLTVKLLQSHDIAQSPLHILIICHGSIYIVGAILLPLLYGIGRLSML